MSKTPDKINDPIGYARHRKRRNASAKKRSPIDRGSVKGRIRLLLKRARKRARSKGIDRGIQIEELYVPTHCPVLGILLDTTPNKRGGNRYSLDRSDSSKGYVTGNVQIISFRANTIKGNATAAELRAVADYVEALEKLREII